MTLGRNAKQLNHTIRNLVSSLIIHEHVTTTPAKAKLAANYLENILVKAKQNQGNKDWSRLLYGKLYNQEVTVDKVCNELTARYADRTGGFTRMIKLEPRFGDNAPQVALELIDNSDKELMFWYIAKVVARLELQGLPLDTLTMKNMNKVIAKKENGEAEFRSVVEICKNEFFKDEELANKPRFKSDKNGFNKQTTNFEFVKRE